MVSLIMRRNFRTLKTSYLGLSYLSLDNYVFLLPHAREHCREWRRRGSKETNGRGNTLWGNQYDGV